MAILIRTYGVIPDCESLRMAVASLLKTEIRFEEGSLKDQVDALDVVGSDLVLVAPDSTNETSARSSVQFLRRLILKHGAWSYLPIVVLGTPAGEENRVAIAQLGVSVNLLGDLQPKKTAEVIQAALQAAWWSAEKNRDVPTFVINAEGTIWRANKAATQLFGVSLLGKAFRQVIENKPEPILPEDHLLRRASREAKVVSEDLTLAGRGHFYAFASPLHTPRGRKDLPVALWLSEASHWPILVEAANTFGTASNREQLFQAIVDQAPQLGFTRARLYEVDGPQLHGRASVGFNCPGRELWFKTWTIEIQCDLPSQETMNPDTGQQQARLWQANDDSAGPSTLLIRRFSGPPNFAEHLEKEGVHCWIEAPIWLPGTDGEPAQLWGKLSLDRGDRSNTLSVRDADKAAELARVAGRAIANQIQRDQLALHRDEEDCWVQEFQRCGVELNRLLAGPVDSSVREKALALVLNTFLKVSGGEIALYREYHEESQTLKRVGEVQYADPSWKTTYEPPLALRKDEFPSRYFQFFNLDNPQPLIESDPRSVLDELLQGRNFEPKADAYLRAIQSELHIPIFNGEKIRGALFIVSTKADAFPVRLLPVIKRLLHIVSIWLEMVRHIHGQLWIDRVLRDTTRLLPKLAASPTADDAFFAGLAALLTAGTGIGWNRAFFFSCHASVLPYTAELVYAIGGLAGTQGANEHAVLQQAISADNALATLDNLVDARIRDPRPHYTPPAGKVLFDALYQLCVEVPRKEGTPLRVDYTPQTQFTASMPTEKVTETVNPIRYLVGQEVTTFPDFPRPTAFPFHCRENQPNQWILDLTKRGFARAFTEEPKRVDFFPLWSMSDGEPEPLGVVAVDLQIPVDQSREDMVAATQVLLGLAADVFAARILARRLRGGINSLETVRHRRDLQDKWNSFCGVLGVKPSEDTSAGKGNEPVPFKVQGNLSQTLGPKATTMLAGYCGEIQKLLHRLMGMDCAGGKTRLVSELRHLKEHYTTTYGRDIQLAVEWEKEVEGISIPADKQVLRDAITCLLGNSKDAIGRMSEEIRPKRLQARLRAHWEKCKPGQRYAGFLIIEYTDNGPGIDAENRRRIFLDGVTSSNDATQRRGHGLTYLLTQLLANRGYIEAVEPPNSGDGARFLICFGIETADIEENATQGASHVQAVDSR